MKKLQKCLSLLMALAMLMSCAGALAEPAETIETGLPQVGTRTDILKAGFDDAGEDGFDYAYRFPGMNRVLQAAGRVIRTQEDKGVVVLLDVRFQEARNRSLFPREWGAVPAVSSEEVYDFLIRRCQSWNEPS